MATTDDSDVAPFTVVSVLERVRAEFNESPGMRLTAPQFCRLFHLDAVTGEAILSALCDVGFLEKDSVGRYTKG